VCPIAVVEALRWLKLDVRKLAMAGVAALLIGAAMILVLQNASTHTIVQRGTLGYLPFIGDRGIGASANELLWDSLWLRPGGDPDDQGTAARSVGVGMFHTLS
jgi:hypothetical protein